MQEYFETEIKRAEKEMVSLKTSMLKSSGSIMTISKSINFSIDLQSTGGSRPSGITKFVINTGSDALFQTSLDSYYDDVTQELNGRYLTRQKYIAVANRFGDIRIDVIGIGTRDDETTIRGGGTVTLTGTLTVQCTNEFTLEPV